MRTKIVWSLGDGGPFTGVSYLNEVIDVKTIVKLTPIIFGPGILMIKWTIQTTKQSISLIIYGDTYSPFNTQAHETEGEIPNFRIIL